MYDQYLLHAAILAALDVSYIRFHIIIIGINSFSEIMLCDSLLWA